MSVEKVREYLTKFGLGNKIIEFSQSSATVALAAEAAGVIPGRIAKTLSFKKEDSVLLIVTAGDQKLDNSKYKKAFGKKAKMLDSQEVEAFTGHPVGGVCPFALPGHIPVYLDLSLQRFDTVFPACGSGNSAIEMTPQELFLVSKAAGWIDVCKDKA